jgi:hypothetical protein
MWVDGVEWCIGAVGCIVAVHLHGPQALVTLTCCCQQAAWLYTCVVEEWFLMAKKCAVLGAELWFLGGSFVVAWGLR